MLVRMFDEDGAIGRLGRASRLTVEQGLTRDEAERVMEQSDDVREAMHARGIGDVGWQVLALTRDQPVSEEEIRAYYAAHPEIFGRRPLDHCRRGIRQLIQIEKAQVELRTLTEAAATGPDLNKLR